MPIENHQNVVPREKKAAEVVQALVLHKVNEFHISRVKEGEKMAGEQDNQQVA
ncbi:MAG: hypothetical protein Q4G11_06100 [Gallicola sp.]|nr:hypothetical protein [Gallicola sp.]